MKEKKKKKYMTIGTGRRQTSLSALVPALHLFKTNKKKDPINP